MELLRRIFQTGINRKTEKKINLDAFCSAVVPDFMPLGGNRPDCAVVMAAVVSLWDWDDQRQQSLPSLALALPPDVLDTAMATVCATIIIHSASDVIEPPPNSIRGDRLTCRLVAASDAAFADWHDDVEVRGKEWMPWRNFDRVCLEIALADSITSMRKDFLHHCPSLFSVDLRATKLHTVGHGALLSCKSLTTVHLPDTLHTVDNSFLAYCTSLVSIDIRNTELHTAENFFMRCCEKLTTVHLPDTLHTVGNGFLLYCPSLVSIDLRNTKLHTMGNNFMYSCEKLTEVHLPDTLHTVGQSCLRRCDSLVSIDLRKTQLHTAEKNFLSSCRNLTAVHLPDTLHTVDHSLLYGCSSLVSIDLRNTKLQNVASFAMYGCEQLTSVYPPETLKLVDGPFCGGTNRLSAEDKEALMKYQMRINPL